MSFRTPSVPFLHYLVMTKYRQISYIDCGYRTVIEIHNKTDVTTDFSAFESNRSENIAGLLKAC